MSLYKEIVGELKKIYPNPQCELVFGSPYELIVAVVLSAQCTDKRVNMVTPKLFEKYPNVQALACADKAELQDIIRPCGFYNNKSKSLIAMSQDIVNKFNGEIPENKEDLKSLAGVGEKTANVVLSTAFGVPAIAVDTHVFRVSNRLGLANGKNVEKTQLDLEKHVDKADWSDTHFRLVLHGRYVCKAINPKCDECKLQNLCKFYAKNTNKKIIKHKK